MRVPLYGVGSVVGLAGIAVAVIALTVAALSSRQRAADGLTTARAPRPIARPLSGETSPPRFVVRQSASARSPPDIPPVVRLPVVQQQLIDAEVARALAQGQLPGCVVLIGRHDSVVFRRAYGARSLRPVRTAMREDTIFDLASLTKPIATAASIMILVEQGRVRLDAPIAEYLVELSQSPHGQATIRQLLLHTSGLPATSALRHYEHGVDYAVRSIAKLGQVHPPGTTYLYSDLGFVLLGEVVRRACGRDLAKFAASQIFEPLRMPDTEFGVPEPQRGRAAPTEPRGGRWLQGIVHDPRAFRLGGTAGHAGLFSTVDDLARFARMLLGQGSLGTVRILKPETWTLMTTAHRLEADVRGLGWDMPNGPSSWSRNAFGHGGFTGTSFWVDPDRDLFVIFLSNRLHPDGKGDTHGLAQRIRELAVAAVPGMARAPVREPPLLLGIDVLRRDGFRALHGARVGLIANASSRARDGRRTADLLWNEPSVELVTLFAPEHGLGADREGTIRDSIDEGTGLPIRSLYGQSLAPTAADLRDLDALVFDLPDAGTRFYTYTSTLRHAMQAAAAEGLRFVVLDRPNPIDGITVEGPLALADQLSFVNPHRLPVRHGMTMGELARLLDAELAIGGRLEVVPLEGWHRTDRFDDTGLFWFNPSPNLRSAQQALLYPALGLLERTNLSVGRGTDRPFEVFGAPWLDAKRVVRQLQEHRLSGVTFAVTRFTPRADPYRGRSCAGVRVRVVEPGAFRAVRTGLAVAHTLLRLQPEWQVGGMAPMLANRATLDALRRGATVAAIEQGWQADLASFAIRRQAALLY